MISTFPSYILIMKIDTIGRQQQVTRGGLLLTEGDNCASDGSVAAHMSDRLLRVHWCVDLVNYRLQNSIVHIVCQSVQVHVAQMRSTQIHFQAE